MKIKIFTALLLSTILFGSCTDLSETVYSDISMNQFFTNEQNLLLNAGRAYTKLQPYPEEQKLWALATISSDECVVCTLQDGSWWDGGRDDEMKQHNVSTSNKINRLAWEYVFGGISACNEVLYETESSPVQFDGKNKIVAEIKVLRALFYYWGLDMWGDLPYTIDFTNKVLPKKKSRTFIYNFVEKEIKDNMALLDSTVATTNYGRVTKGLAYTLLAKLYLNSNVWINTPRWAEAEQMCDKVIASRQYKLEANYFDNFAVKNETSKENIFVIVNNSLLTHSFYWYDLTLSPLSQKTFSMKDTPWDGYICPPDFFNSYSDKDLRKKSWLYGQQYDATGKKLFEMAKKDTVWFVYNPIFPETKYKSRNKWDGARCIKYAFQTDGLQNGTLDMDNDFVLFRYADVIMMKVESMMRQNKTAEAAALPDFQKIRTRVGMPPYTSDQLTFDELLAERGREFAWEGHRRQDLIRFGKWNNACWAKPVTTTQSVFPIPQTAIDTNPNLSLAPEN
jgi:starch-binding outer membrane protein, SusD/RagB family